MITDPVFAQILPDGSVNCICSFYDERVFDGATFDGILFKNLPQEILNQEDILDGWFYKNEWQFIGRRPSRFHRMDTNIGAWVANTEEAKSEKKNEIESELTSRLYLPCNGFDADKTSRERISGMIARLQRGDGLPAGWIGWRDAENTMHWETDDAATVLANLTTLSRAIEDREQALLVASWQHKANIEKLSTIEEILAYDVTKNWPS